MILWWILVKHLQWFIIRILFVKKPSVYINLIYYCRNIVEKHLITHWLPLHSEQDIFYKKHITSIERKRERNSERAQVTTICQQPLHRVSGLWWKKPIMIYNNSQEKCTCQETEWWLSVCINLCSCLCWPSTWRQSSGQVSQQYTQKQAHTNAFSSTDTGARALHSPKLKAICRKARLNLVIISREVSFDLLFMSVLKLSSF